MYLKYVQAKSEHAQTFETLTEYLKQNIRFHSLPDLMIARALIVWLAYQPVKGGVMVAARTDSPRGLIKLLSQGKLTYAEVYAALCRSVTIFEGLFNALNIPFDD